MSSRNNIQANGTVTEVLPHDAYRVELANGHRCVARASGEIRFSSGDIVQIKFHPYDLSRGRIVDDR